MGTKRKLPLHCRFDTHGCCPRKRPDGGRRQSRWLRTADGFAVFEAAFLCWLSLRKKSNCDQISVASHTARPFVPFVMIGRYRRKLGLRRFGRVSGLFLWRTRIRLSNRHAPTAHVFLPNRLDHCTGSARPTSSNRPTSASAKCWGFFFARRSRN
jgi:hypothetical protein